MIKIKLKHIPSIISSIIGLSSGYKNVSPQQGQYYQFCSSAKTKENSVSQLVHSKISINLSNG
jgi:hypothetical protein